MKKRKIILMVCIVILLFCSIAIIKQTDTSSQTSKLINASVVSNSTIAWGVKRASNHEQPDLGSKNLEILEKYNGIAMGNAEKKYVYLTFDEGYEAGYTSQILATLKENNVKATFFITAHYLNTQEELVKQMIEEGHIVGNQF